MVSFIFIKQNSIRNWSWMSEVWCTPGFSPWPYIHLWLYAAPWWHFLEIWCWFSFLHGWSTVVRITNDFSQEFECQHWWLYYFWKLDHQKPWSDFWFLCDILVPVSCLGYYRTAFSRLRNIAKIWAILTLFDAEAIILHGDCALNETDWYR